jgi:hypothetical protein
MKTQTRSKKKYIEAWHSHIDSMWALCWTPNKELSDEVENTLNKLKSLVEKIAEDKGLK